MCGQKLKKSFIPKEKIFEGITLNENGALIKTGLMTFS